MGQEERLDRFISDRQWHHINAIQEYLAPGRQNVAARSRIAHLKKKLETAGETILSRKASPTDPQYEYRRAYIGELPV